MTRTTPLTARLPPLLAVLLPHAARTLRVAFRPLSDGPRLPCLLLLFGLGCLSVRDDYGTPWNYSAGLSVAACYFAGSLLVYVPARLLGAARPVRRFLSAGWGEKPE